MDAELGRVDAVSQLVEVDVQVLQVLDDDVLIKLEVLHLRLLFPGNSLIETLLHEMSNLLPDDFSLR